ncbi:hypothetical protein PVK06_023302 [Gossypium arboreum]|uniref:Uncharacterized protein n=1 Tax=Gossypium arboreum TaxID=29729 RepID=A0ABR0PB12_GOSAR|nr:hypothetical protein PVK06_023302 [Gossypium arboreum]
MGRWRSDPCNKDKLFLFEAKWCLENSFEEEIKRNWADISGSIPDKLERMGQQF